MILLRWEFDTMNLRVSMQKAMLYLLAGILCFGSEQTARAMDDTKKTVTKVVLASTLLAGMISYGHYEHKKQTDKDLTFSKSVKDDVTAIKSSRPVQFVGKASSFAVMNAYKGATVPFKLGRDVCINYPVIPYAALGLFGLMAAHPESVQALIDCVKSTYATEGIQVAKPLSGFLGEIFTKNWGLIATYLAAPTVFNQANTGLQGLFGIKKKKDDSSGKSPYKRYTSGTNGILFKDVIGFENNLGMQEAVKLLTDPYAEISGLVLDGEPGTGKTYFVKALSNELDFGFVFLDASTVVTRWQGSGGENIKNAFQEARILSKELGKKVILGIDEGDTIAAQRPTDPNLMSKAEVQACNALLTELDGLEGNKDVIVVMTTNRAHILDGAVVRPGRLSTRITIDELKDKTVIRNTFVYYIQKQINDRKLSSKLSKDKFDTCLNDISIDKITPAAICETVKKAFIFGDGNHENISQYILNKYSSKKIKLEDENKNKKEITIQNGKTEESQSKEIIISDSFSNNTKKSRISGWTAQEVKKSRYMLALDISDMALTQMNKKLKKD